METEAPDKKVKHTIYLSPATSRRLKRTKGETDRTLSEIVESLVSRHCGDDAPRRDRASVAR